ncbi:hypothetical protein BDV95DRAFT_492066 [Massariosphaeria phaeospora]|uniref:NodB homology domain-containing protein n=1 Tax=Massariosphaeria phaeospora TaxID=100035 RepID=A0A7C8M7C5_9PLEO|nr:hypothetical protein BDV95DRAFT_492066 [Massariosphaeria phaeospora]
MSFLELEGLHVFVTGAAGGIGRAVVEEFLARGCKVTAHDKRPNTLSNTSSLQCIQGDISSEPSNAASIAEATTHFGPINILCANAGITDESASYPIWDMPLTLWETTYAVNVRGTSLTIKHFLKSVERAQQQAGEVLANVAIVVTGSECGVFGQAGHVEYASGKAALQYGLVKTVKNEVVRLNAKARINAVAPGWVDTELIKGRLDDAKEMYREAQATVPLRKIAQPTDVARAAAFLASHRAAGHISGQCLSVDGGMEGRIVWSEDEIQQSQSTAPPTPSIPPYLPLSTEPQAPPLTKVKILISVDFDAVSGWLGTGAHPDNNLADYSSGFFSAYVGVPRLLKLFKKLGIQDKLTWFVPMHSAESFPQEFSSIVDSGAEIGLHGYSHEGASQLTPTQQSDILTHCITLYTSLVGRPPAGYRAPLYQLSCNTIPLLESHSLLYDSSLTHHDSRPYYLTPPPPITAPTFTPTTPAKAWMKPIPRPANPTTQSLVEMPANWYAEDMTPLQYFPHAGNSQGYVDVRVVERMWKDRFEWVRGERGDLGDRGMCVFPLVLHPDTSGMAHVIGMIERVLLWLKTWGEDEVEFCTFESAAREWKAKNPPV